MRVILLILHLFLFFQSTYAQVAIIQDKDGWTNVRSKPDGNSEIIYRIYTNQVFWVDHFYSDKEQNWIKVDIPKNKFCLNDNDNNYISGFVHKSQIKMLKNMNEYHGNDFSFEYIIIDFDSTNRIIDKQEGSFISEIDGRPVWGTDGTFPRKQVDDIKVIIDGNVIDIQEVFYSDIYECDNEFSIYKNNDTYYVHQWNSDCAGTYEIVWVLDKCGLKQRYIGRDF
jgi:hypothetical protein